MSAGRWPEIRRVLSIVARVGIAAAAVAFLARGVAWPEVRGSLRDANLALLVAVVVVNAGMLAVKAMRLDLLLGGRPSFRTCLLAKVTASAINNVAPLRSGDVARLWMLERRAGIPKAASAAVALVEMLLELAALAAIGMAGAIALPNERWASALAPVLFAGAMVALFLLRRAGRTAFQSASEEPALSDGSVRGRLRGLWLRMAPGVQALGSSRSAGFAVALSFVAWGLEALMILLCARALHVPIQTPLALLVLLGINVALVLPSLPAGAGAFEAAVALVLMLGGVAKGPAIAFAIVYHLVQVVPVTAAGAWIVLKTGVTLG
jgi:uncharacterized protein (TIRG00374 family)